MMNRSVLKAEGMRALRNSLGTVGAETFIFLMKTEEQYDYTEWRKDNLYKGMTDDEMIEDAVEYIKSHPPEFDNLEARY